MSSAVITTVRVIPMRRTLRPRTGSPRRDSIFAPALRRLIWEVCTKVTMANGVPRKGTTPGKPKAKGAHRTVNQFDPVHRREGGEGGQSFQQRPAGGSCDNCVGGDDSRRAVQPLELLCSTALICRFSVARRRPLAAM